MFLHLYLPNPAIVIQKSSFPFYPCFGTFIKFYVKLSAQYISRAYYAHMTEKEWTGKKGWSWENRLLKFEIDLAEHTRTFFIVPVAIPLKNRKIDFIKVCMTVPQLPPSPLCCTLSVPLLLLLLLLSTDITLPRIWNCLVLVTRKLIFSIHGVCGCLLRSLTLSVRCGAVTYCVVYIVFISLQKNETLGAQNDQLQNR